MFSFNIIRTFLCNSKTYHLSRTGSIYFLFDVPHFIIATREGKRIAHFCEESDIEKINWNDDFLYISCGPIGNYIFLS